MRIDEMLTLWIEITGVNPADNRTTWELNFDGRLSDWDIKKMNEKIIEVSKYDEEGIFTKIFLREYFDKYIKDRTVSISNYLNNKNHHKEYFKKCEDLKQALEEIDENETHIMDTTHKAMEFYNIKNSVDIFDIAYLRISANQNINNLNTVQFKKGKTTSEKPKYARDIHMVNSIDSLIKTVEKEYTDGIYLNYIYDQDEPSSSYFTFTIKNGENIFIMCDKANYKHPNQKYMSRAKGRHMSERMDKTYFPYSLTNLEMDRYYVIDKNADKINETGYTKIGTISDMETSEALWTVIMFSLIQEKFFTNNYQCKEISYVGGMVQHALLAENNTSITVYNSFEKLELPIITEPDKIELEYEYESKGLFNDEIERLKEQVDMDLVNHTSYTDKVFTEVKLLGNNSIQTMETDLLSLNLNEFGTKEELEYRQKWVARYNFAKQINKLAEKEYTENIKKVNKWYETEVWNNINNIIDMVIGDKLVGETIITRHAGIIYTKKTTKIVRKFTLKEYQAAGYWGGHILNQSRGWVRTCSFTGKPASIAISIFPNNVEDIKKLTGCTDVPEMLKNWKQQEKRHSGNCILDNIDPCDWVITDYWHNFSGQIDIMLSKTAYNNLYKERGLAPDKFWTEN